MTAAELRQRLTKRLLDEERFPSVSVLNRIDGLLAQLEQAEQQERRRELTAA